MRKSTVFALAVIFIAFGGMLFMLDFYTSQFKQEIANAKELTTEFEESLAPEGTIKLARVRGGSKYVVHDEARPGVLVDASPSVETWAKDVTGTTFARSVALRLFGMYGEERPIQWVQFRLFRPDGTQLPLFGIELDESGGLRVIEGDTPRPRAGVPAPPPREHRPGPPVLGK